MPTRMGRGHEDNLAGKMVDQAGDRRYPPRMARCLLAQFLAVTFYAHADRFAVHHPAITRSFERLRPRLRSNTVRHVRKLLSRAPISDGHAFFSR